MNEIRKTLMGMPHVNCTYVGNFKGKAIGPCVICGQPAHDAHHLVPKGMGGSDRTYTLITGKYGRPVLLSPLFAVCGSGNTSGCHGKFHSHEYSVKWIWNDEETEQKWLDGYWLCHGYEPNGAKLFELGHYEITDRNGETLVIDTPTRWM